MTTFDHQHSPTAGRPTGTIGELAVGRASALGNRPFLTFYDEATGERTELSHATLHNWASKTANMLVEDLEVEPGSLLLSRLGTHWTCLTVAVAAWRAGARLLLVPETGPSPEAGQAPQAAFVREDLLGQGAQDDPSAGPPPGGLDDPSAGPPLDALSASDAVVAVGRGLGGRLSPDAGEARGYAEEVLAFGDEFDDPPLEPGAGALVALLAGPAGPATASLSHADVLAVAAQACGGLTGGEGERVCSVLPLDGADGLVLGPVATLLAGGGLVLVANADPQRLWRHALDERCTTVLAPPSQAAALAAAAPDGAPPVHGVALNADENGQIGVSWG